MRDAPVSPPERDGARRAPARVDPLRSLRTWQRFHIRLMLVFSLTTLLALVLLGWGFYRTAVDAELASLQQRLLSTVTGLAASIDAQAVEAVPVSATRTTPLHRELAARFAQVAQQDPHIETIYLLRPTERPTQLRFMVDFAKSGRAGRPGEPYDASEVPVMLQGFARPTVEDEPYADAFGVTLSGYAPVMTADGRSVGLVGVDVTAEQLAAMRRTVLWQVAVAFGLTMLVLAVAAVLVARNVRRPLSRIIDAADAISRGDLDTRINLQRDDELGLMSRHFDRMAQQLQEREFIRETFGRYVSERVARELLKGGGGPALGGEERVVTVLFSDLQGYAALSERLPPPRVVEMLNLYFGEMNQIIDLHGGCVIEFLGDAILAVYGAPSYLPDHAEAAVRSAQAMRRRLAELDHQWREADLARYWRDGSMPAVTARIGVHTGRVVAGNVGSHSRMKYAVIGDTVNIASRLEGLNKTLGTDVLVSHEVYGQLPHELGRLFEARGEHRVKGRDQPVQVYAMSGAAPALRLLRG